MLVLTQTLCWAWGIQRGLRHSSWLRESHSGQGNRFVGQTNEPTNQPTNQPLTNQPTKRRKPKHCDNYKNKSMYLAPWWELLERPERKRINSIRCKSGREVRRFLPKDYVPAGFWWVNRSFPSVLWRKSMWEKEQHLQRHSDRRHG